MCLSCGCGRPDDPHGDCRHITALDLQGAADAAGITPEQAAANIVATLAGPVEKSSMISDAWTTLLKAEPERRYTLMLALPALKPDIAKAADGRRDYVRPEVVENTAWDWMLKSRNVGLYHEDGTDGRGQVVESYVYRGPDWVIKATADGREVVIKAGDWLVGTVWDEAAWALVKRGLVNGMSPQGSAVRAPADPSLTFDR